MDILSSQQADLAIRLTSVEQLLARISAVVEQNAEAIRKERHLREAPVKERSSLVDSKSDVAQLQSEILHLQSQFAAMESHLNALNEALPRTVKQVSQQATEGNVRDMEKRIRQDIDDAFRDLMQQMNPGMPDGPDFSASFTHRRLVPNRAHVEFAPLDIANDDLFEKSFSSEVDFQYSTELAGSKQAAPRSPSPEGRSKGNPSRTGTSLEHTETSANQSESHDTTDTAVRDKYFPQSTRTRVSASTSMTRPRSAGAHTARHAGGHTDRGVRYRHMTQGNPLGGQKQYRPPSAQQPQFHRSSNGLMRLQQQQRPNTAGRERRKQQTPISVYHLSAYD